MSNRSPSFHVWSFLLGCIWSLAFGSAFRLGLFSFRKHSVSTRVESGTTSTTMFSPSVLSLSRRSISSSSSSSLSPSPSPVMMEAVPSGRKRRKFQQVRKRIFSRTRRGYRNDGDGIVILVDEDVSSEPETPMSTETVDEENSDKAMRKAEIGARIRAIREETQGQHQQLTRKRPRYTPYLPSLAGKKKPKPLQVETVEELRHAILDQQLRLSDTTIVEAKSQSNVDAAQTTAGKGVPPVLDHAVRDLIKERFVNGTTPGHRLPEDKATLALAIEGGGMRGCVSAGMVAALTALGLSDTVDSIYGSSAGSVVGAYMVSRQVCLDVYVDILPASKKLFVCKKRMVANLASLGLTQMLGKRNSRKTGNGKQKIDFISSSTLSPPSPLPKTLRERLLQTQPGMNISFVLDGIMGDDHGLRPLDVQAFRENSEKQKLRVVSSCVDPATGKLLSKCFGSKEFFCKDESLTSPDRKRQGLFACLQASMTVPGATGPPINLVRKNEASEDPLPCFDAFCFEPIPYRSAVEEGATHVLVLTTRPEDFVPKV
ncbi:unnamed protein product [Pseudo-nitzschia multistriata]|uniref:PNPLA domain-containing protein n=1 Tax=Pseudo-nitzschia multistriata TaxID=183589 RepID=A0A448YVM7_9STRA|nr:unnamed protein product [Pseudo-nitzschia multistriata]